MVADQLAPANGLFQYDAETQEGQQEWPRCPAAMMWSVRWTSLQARIQLMSTACTQGKPKSASTCLMNRTSSGFGHNPLRLVSSLADAVSYSNGSFAQSSTCIVVNAQVKWRHKHFAAASLAITEQLERFRLMNRRAISHSTSKTANDGGDSQALDATAMRRLVNALPQYRCAWSLEQSCHVATACVMHSRKQHACVCPLSIQQPGSSRRTVVCREQLSKLAVHVEIASRLSAAIESGCLTEIGALEQAAVYGDAGSKELIALLTGPLAPKLQASDKVHH